MRFLFIYMEKLFLSACYFSSDAINVTVRENWGTESFDLREGEMIYTWPTVAAGSQVSHNVTLAPKQEGEISGFRAIVQYKTSADGQLQV